MRVVKSFLGPIRFICTYNTLFHRSVHSCVVFKASDTLLARNLLLDSSKPFRIFHNNDPFVEIPADSCATTDLTDPRAFVPSASAIELLKRIRTVVELCASRKVSIEEPCFQDFAKDFCGKTRMLDDEHILEALRQLTLLPPLKSSTTRNYIDLWNSLDIECCRRVINWSVEQQLFVCDAWYRLNILKVCSYAREAMYRFGRRVRQMEPESMVQTAFFSAVMKRPISDMIDFERNTLKHFERLTLQELSVVAWCFSSTNQVIHSPKLISKIFERLLAELEIINEASFSNLLKMLQASNHIGHNEFMRNLLKAIRPRLDDLSLQALLDVGSLGLRRQICDDVVIEAILRRFEQNISDLTLRDIRNLLELITTFGYKSPNGIERRISGQIPDILRQHPNEVLRCPRIFLEILHFLTLLGIAADHELFAGAFDERFIEYAEFKKRLLSRTYFHLDVFTEVNLGDLYVGRRLTKAQRCRMGKSYTEWLPDPKYKITSNNKVLLNMKETFDTMQLRASLELILPQYDRADLVICYDEHNQAVVPISSDRTSFSGLVMTRERLLGGTDELHISTVVFVLAAPVDVIRGNDRITGRLSLKLNQLELLGHKPIMVRTSQWVELNTVENKQQFLHEKLAKVLEIKQPVQISNNCV